MKQLEIVRSNPDYGFVLLTMHCFKKASAASFNDSLNEFKESAPFLALLDACSKKDFISLSEDSLHALITSSDFICKLLVSAHSENAAAYFVEELSPAFGSKDLFITYYLKASDQFFNRIKEAGASNPDLLQFLFSDTDWNIQ